MIAIAAVVVVWVAVVGVVAVAQLEQREDRRQAVSAERAVEMLRLRLAKRYPEQRRAETPPEMTEPRLAA